MFLKRLGALMVKTHISTFSNPYLNQKRYGFQEVEIWVTMEWSETSRQKIKKGGYILSPFLAMTRSDKDVKNVKYAKKRPPPYESGRFSSYYHRRLILFFP